MPRPPRRKEHVDDGENFAVVGLATDVSTTQFGDAEAGVVMLALCELREQRTPRGAEEADIASIEGDRWSRGKLSAGLLAVLLKMSMGPCAGPLERRCAKQEGVASWTHPPGQAVGALLLTFPPGPS